MPDTIVDTGESAVNKIKLTDLVQLKYSSCGDGEDRQINK